MQTVSIKTALISVSDKTGLVTLVESLAANGVKILSTGGTYRAIVEAGFEVTEVADHTGFPEMMEGRVKTLHPVIHGGLLGRSGLDEDIMSTHGISPIDLLVVNLYPFESVVQQPNCQLPEAIENIDIGGPAMIRSAAKNFDRVTVVTSPEAYAPLIEALKAGGGSVDREFRFACAKQAFGRIAEYDAAISNYLMARETEADAQTPIEFPEVLSEQWVKIEDMRYGENPHQQAAYYQERYPQPGSLAGAKQLQGKAMSFNNVADADAALDCVRGFTAPTCVIVKHANPCGVATADNHVTAYDRAFATDPTSAFGGILAFNGEVDQALAQRIVDRQFVEVIVAEAVSQEAQVVLATKKNIRVLVVEKMANPASGYDTKRISGGLLVQSKDLTLYEPDALRTVSQRAPTPAEHEDLLFAWKVAKSVKSNAIVYARDGQTIGVGAGQMSRVYSAKIAGIKAADESLVVAGSVMASDAFFPFRDGIDAAAAAGISAVIQPGGSVRDDEVIQAADEAGMAMVFTQMRHFKH